MIRMQLKGEAAVRKALAGFPKSYVRKALSPSMKAVIKDVVVRDAQRTAPVKTGTLRKSIKVRSAKNSKGRPYKRGVFGWAAVTVKTKTIDAFYAGFMFIGYTKRDGVWRKGTRDLQKALYNNASVINAWLYGLLKREVPRIAREYANKKGGVFPG